MKTLKQSRGAVASFLFLFCLSSCATRNASKPQPRESASEKNSLQTSLQLGRRWAIATQGVIATQAAKKMLDDGGNLVDAFVASSFVQAVERPQSTGLGGGGFALIRQAETGRSLAFDFREQAPRKIRPKDYQSGTGVWDPTKSQDGPLAAGTPGFVPGLLQIHRLYGKLRWREVLQPAIEAAQGFNIGSELAEELNSNRERLSQQADAKAIFVKTDASAWVAGDRLEQKDLAESLRILAIGGLVAWNNKVLGPGLEKLRAQKAVALRMSDLQTYQVRIRTPLRATLGSPRNFVSMPPPSSGGLLAIQVLKGLELLGRLEKQTLDPSDFHALAFLLQHAFADRARYLGDPDFVKVPVESLLDSESMKARVGSFRAEQATPQSEVTPTVINAAAAEPDHTIHLSLLDRDGNAISSTQTINGSFGSAWVVPGTGVVLNNQMDDFALGGMTQGNLFGAVGGTANRLAPKKRPLSSMSPSFLENQNRVEGVIGSPSGTRIISCVTQAAWGFLRSQDPETVQKMTRLHHQWTPDQILMESDGPLKTALENLGYQVVVRDLGCRMPMVGQFPDGRVWALSDPRGNGAALAE